jgi:hypothetical protein
MKRAGFSLRYYFIVSQSGEEPPPRSVSPGGKVAEVRRVTRGPKRAPIVQ